mgnify:CR=1 FL=1
MHLITSSGEEWFNRYTFSLLPDIKSKEKVLRDGSDLDRATPYFWITPEFLPSSSVWTLKLPDQPHMEKRKKYRLVVGGHLSHFQGSSYSATLDNGLARAMLRIGVLRKWTVGITDVGSAFLNAKIPESRMVVVRPPKFLSKFWVAPELPSPYLSASLRRGVLFVSTRLAIAGPPSLHLSPFFGKRLINCALLVKRSSYLHSGSKFRSGGPAIARDKKYIYYSRDQIHAQHNTLNYYSTAHVTCICTLVLYWPQL